MGKKRTRLHGTVQKIIKSAVPSEPEKAQIDIHQADDLYREIRIENAVTDENGEKLDSNPEHKWMSLLKQIRVPR